MNRLLTALGVFALSGCFWVAQPPPPQPQPGPGYNANPQPGYPTDPQPGPGPDYTPNPDYTPAGGNQGSTASYPRVMIAIPEFHISHSDRIPDPAAETEFIKTFIKAGFKVIDKKQAEKVWKDDVIFKLEKEEDISAAAALAFKLGAEYLILGEAFSEQGNVVPTYMGSIRTDIYLTKARVEIKVIRVDDAKIIWADDENGSGKDTTEIISGKNALKDAGMKLSKRVVKEVERQLQGGSPGVAGSVGVRTSDVEIVLSFPTGNLTLSEVKSFKDAAMKQIPGLREIVQREFIEGAATLEFIYEGDSQGLAEALDGQKFGKRTASISKQSGSKLFVNLK